MLLNNPLNITLYNEHKNSKQFFIIIIINFFFNSQYEIIPKIG